MTRNPDAIEAAARTGHARYAEMCDESHPGFDAARCEAYRPLVAAIVRGAPPAAGPRPAPADAPRPRYEPLTRAWLGRVNTCPYRACHSGCAAARCHAGRGDHYGNTTLQHCRACLRAADPEARP